MIQTFEELRSAAEELLLLNRIYPVNILSPASTTKDILLRSNGKEFSITEQLSNEDFRFLHACYKGPRMETRTLGTLKNAESLDLRKAYLRALLQCPSLYKDNIVRIVRGDKIYHEQAHPGSAYVIRVKIPESYSSFPPIPFRHNGLYYPHGEFVAKVSKPILELLRMVKDIEYEILDSLQIITLDEKSPFTNLCNEIEFFEEVASEKFHYINPKFLHYSMTGHFLHYHREIDRRTGEISYVASQDYNPILACAVSSIVSKEIWVQSQIQDTVAIRADAITGHNLSSNPNYKKTKKGEMTFLTPFLKDRPGESVYRDLIRQNRHKPYVEVHGERRISLVQAYDSPKDIGKTYQVDIKIPVSAGNRLVDSKHVLPVGKLLEGSIPTIVPRIEKVFKDPYEHYSIGDHPWIDTYLRLFHQIKT